MSADKWLAKISGDLVPGIGVLAHNDLPPDLTEAAATQYNQGSAHPFIAKRAVVVVMKVNRSGFPVPAVLIGLFDSHGCAVGTLQVPVVSGPSAGGDHG
jgi:hypothetical protein